MASKKCHKNRCSHPYAIHQPVCYSSSRRHMYYQSQMAVIQRVRLCWWRGWICQWIQKGLFEMERFILNSSLRNLMANSKSGIEQSHFDPIAVTDRERLQSRAAAPVLGRNRIWWEALYITTAPTFLKAESLFHSAFLCLRIFDSFSTFLFWIPSVLWAASLLSVTKTHRAALIQTNSNKCVPFSFCLDFKWSCHHCCTPERWQMREWVRHTPNGHCWSVSDTFFPRHTKSQQKKIMLAFLFVLINL